MPDADWLIDEQRDREGFPPRPPLEDFILSLANAARELGVDRERARILRLIGDLPTAMTGGPELKDRIVRAITDGGKA